MFTGIVEEGGRIKALGRGWLTIGARKVLEETQPGDSINVDGACLTVTRLEPGALAVDVMAETLRRTNLGQRRPGDLVNLERALAVGGRFGGHFVQGHVEGTGKVLSRTPQEGALLVRIGPPRELGRYIVDKGFIAVDGISLTVVARDEASFAVSLVAYTAENTTLAGKRPGDLVNLETDIMAKYVERFRGAREPSLTMEFLEEQGFAQTPRRRRE